MESVLRVHSDCSSLSSYVISDIPKYSEIFSLNERRFKVGWFVAIGPCFGVPTFLSQLDVVAVVFAFLALQKMVCRAAVLVQCKRESDSPM